MSKKKKKISCGKITSKQIFDAQKPQFNGFAYGYGSHGDKSYNRRRMKEQFRKELREAFWQNYNQKVILLTKCFM